MNIDNQFLARCFGAYMGGEYFMNDKYGEYKVSVTPELIASICCGSARNGKLLLTPLSSITDEAIMEAYEFCKVDLYVTDFSKDLFLHSFDPSNVAESKNRWGQSMYYDMQDFLRSKGYMIPFMGVDLFESGIAIDKTTIGK